MPPKKCYCPVTHVIFDCDGTLIDSEGIYLRTVQELVAPFGLTYSKADQTQYMGMPMCTFSHQIVKDLNLPLSPAEFRQRFDAATERNMKSVNLLPGVRDLILHLHEYRIPFCIATSSYRKGFKVKAESFKDIFLAFHHVVCGDDPALGPGRGKPQPDIYLLAASRFNPPADPTKCLIFEDAPVGLRGGIAAGSQVVFIPTEHVSKPQRKGATKVLKSMADFKPELFGLPAFDTCSKFEFG
ncbi:pseudouridine-5'-phosphatase isoform X1 [Drosophila teissieri]|uniref:pseudouridine-5'-phosphatase isoform X1 n=2 Tax=Drosophila teissieri TaxID=7243 RepID=UPI001CBA0A1C|nr:pseudouridine-5'-phosphatase isoform X1 [Drosophila teissieri]